MKQDKVSFLGIPCPQCGSTKRRVVESRPQINFVARRCVCQTCSHRFTTHEKLKDQDVLSPDFLFAVLRRISAVENAISTLRRSIETGLQNYKFDDDK